MYNKSQSVMYYKLPFVMYNKSQFVMYYKLRDHYKLQRNMDKIRKLKQNEDISKANLCMKTFISIMTSKYLLLLQ